ncbi:sulfate adenylyltransferase [Candidatus Woesearchaeota archaeon]|nr:sulfate adenylyltransferase [Candidatus Woesearchaeota archaeon]
MALGIPHGGKLISRVLAGNEREKALEEAKELPGISVRQETLLDLGNIAHGVFSPLQGFVTQNDFLSILHEKTLENGTPWTIPVTFPVHEPPENCKAGDDVALFGQDAEPIALLRLEEIYSFNIHEAAKAVFGTADTNHPGVGKMHEMGNTLLAGEIDLLKEPDPVVKGYDLAPLQARSIFQKNKWKTVVGFQTRNVPHRAHEYLQKAALELVDGILLHPLIGWKKDGDYKPEAIIHGYEALIRHYYPKNRAVLAALTTQMRYAGPREAVFHSIIRKNFGCTHFIVGRDHAGVGNYYGTYDAHAIFNEFPDLGIEILKMKGPYYCRHCGHVTTEKTCPHGKKEHFEISGTLIRKMLGEGKIPPKEMMREEVARLLSKEVLI